MANKNRMRIVIGAPDEDVNQDSPGDVFASRLREMRGTREENGRPVSLDGLARVMTENGRPLGKQSLLRIEHGSRSVSLDEALGLAYLLDVPFETMLSPAGDGLVWLVDGFGVDSEALREWLRHGLRTSESRKANLAESAARLLDRHGKALVDALRVNDKAGVNQARAALGKTAIAYQTAIEKVER